LIPRNFKVFRPLGSLYSAPLTVYPVNAALVGTAGFVFIKSLALAAEQELYSLGLLLRSASPISFKAAFVGTAGSVFIRLWASPQNKNSIVWVLTDTTGVPLP